MMTDNLNNSSRGRLQRAFGELAAGHLDEARREFSSLCGDPEVSVDAYRGLAAVAWRMGQGASAIEFLRQAVQIDGAHFEARADLALLLMMAGQVEAALPEWERVVQMRPDDADVWHNYAKLLGDMRQLEASRSAFERSLMLKPGRVPTLSAYARMLSTCGDLAGAEALWNRVVGIDPGQAEGYLGLAEAQFESGQLERALETYRKGTEAVAESADLQMGYAQVLEDLADREGAERAFRQALTIRPDWSLAMEGLLTLIRGDAEPELLERARAIVDDRTRPPQDRANVGFGLGKALDAQGKYAEAFEVWNLANAARRLQIGPYDRSRLADRIDRTMRAFSPSAISRLSGAGAKDSRPVFVLGMPRSGTSLVEQIIAAHPDATGFGEMRDISLIARSMPQRVGSIQRWPEALEAVTGDVLNEAAAAYLHSLQRRCRVEVSRWVDKAPLNFFHVGLIGLLFPNARIVWCRRDPRDVCVSIYGENFALEQGFATDLADLGYFYREHSRLMRYWQSVMPGRIYECRYEELVADPGVRARALVDAIGLPWDDACLRFYEQDRPVLTPSRWQVRQPMYSRSVGRWKRYEPWIGRLVEALADEVEA